MTLRWLDASTPPSSYPSGFDGIAFYIGGDTPHVWSTTEINACPYRYRLPIFVRSDPAATGATAQTDVAAAVMQLAAIGAPKGILVAWDSEVSQDPQYIQAVFTDLINAGYYLIDYGSQSYVFGNDNPDGYYWGAQWTNVGHIVTGDVMTQYASLGGYDDSWGNPTGAGGQMLPWWDTQTGTPALPTLTAPKVTVPPPGQWEASSDWQWYDAQIIGIGLDGQLHAFVITAGNWSKVF